MQTIHLSHSQVSAHNLFLCVFRSFSLCPFHLFPASGNPIHLTLRIISSNQGPLGRQGRALRDRLTNSLMGLDFPPVHHLRKPTLGQSPLHIVSYGCHLATWLCFLCVHHAHTHTYTHTQTHPLAACSPIYYSDLAQIIDSSCREQFEGATTQKNSLTRTSTCSQVTGLSLGLSFQIWKRDE